MTYLQDILTQRSLSTAQNSSIQFYGGLYVKQVTRPALPCPQNHGFRCRHTQVPTVGSCCVVCTLPGMKVRWMVRGKLLPSFFSLRTASMYLQREKCAAVLYTYVRTQTMHARTHAHTHARTHTRTHTHTHTHTHSGNTVSHIVTTVETQDLTCYFFNIRKQSVPVPTHSLDGYTLHVLHTQQQHTRPIRSACR